MIRQAMSLLGRPFEDILRLFCHVQTSYIGFGVQFYRQIDGMAMGFPLAPVNTIFSLEDCGSGATVDSLLTPLLVPLHG
jgi:hypothetical protein